jgi:hypothetical protein
VLSTNILPPGASTIRLQIENPNPMPFALLMKIFAKSLAYSFHVSVKKKQAMPSWT